MSHGAKANRPLSPHLQVYKPQINSFTSIIHRATGVALAAGVLMLAWWLVAAATGPGSFEYVQGFLGHWIGRIVLFGFTWALMYHLLNGIRHLYWDTGRGLSKEGIAPSGWLVIGGSVVLTLVSWAIGYGMI